jgi:hypothetical protein
MDRRHDIFQTAEDALANNLSFSSGRPGGSPCLGRGPVAAVLSSLFGLGYSTLNRYDPRNVPGLYDTRAYAAMVSGEPLEDDQIDLSHRMLVPYLAKPLYWLAAGDLKTWVFFALLAVNSFFIVTTACLLVSICFRITGNYAVALIAGFIYLADFAVANFNLCGYVDSAVNFASLAVAWSLLGKRWWLLPLWGAVGALAKETFVPLACALVLAWWVTAWRRREAKAVDLVWFGAMAALGLATVSFTMAHT